MNCFMLRLIRNLFPKQRQLGWYFTKMPYKVRETNVKTFSRIELLTHQFTSNFAKRSRYDALQNSIGWSRIIASAKKKKYPFEWSSLSSNKQYSGSQKTHTRAYRSQYIHYGWLVERSYHWPIFFENEHGTIITVNGDTYRTRITHFFCRTCSSWCWYERCLVLIRWCNLPHIIGSYSFENKHGTTIFLFVLAIRDIDMNDVWFQQDGATCHTSLAHISLKMSTGHNHYSQRKHPSYHNVRIFLFGLRYIDMNDVWFHQDGATCHTKFQIVFVFDFEIYILKWPTLYNLINSDRRLP